MHLFNIKLELEGFWDLGFMVFGFWFFMVFGGLGFMVFGGWSVTTLQGSVPEIVGCIRERYRCT